MRGPSPVAALWFSARALLALAALVLLLHWPVYLDAHRRGFAWPFVRQYADWSASFVAQVRQRLATPLPPAPAKDTGDAPAAARPAGPLIVPASETLARKSLAALLRAATPEERNLTLLLYAPLLSLGLLISWSTVRLFTTWRRRETEAGAAALGALLLLGGALTDFPQYFFFRPDSPHLSEFSPGFWVATAGSLLLLATTGQMRSRYRPTAVALLALLLSAHAGLYLWRMLPDRFTGTVSARYNRTVLFQGENGVNVYVTRHEIGGLRKIQEIVRDHTLREDYLVAYPYHPIFNVLTDRRTYERNVYVDNAIAEPGWNAGAIARLERYRPAVVILSDWEINGTPKSRFSVWAAPTRQWIQEHYTLQGSYLNYEIYTRPETATGRRRRSQLEKAASARSVSPVVSFRSRRRTSPSESTESGMGAFCTFSSCGRMKPAASVEAIPCPLRSSSERCRRSSASSSARPVRVSVAFMKPIFAVTSAWKRTARSVSLVRSRCSSCTCAPCCLPASRAASSASFSRSALPIEILNRPGPERRRFSRISPAMKTASRASSL